MDTVSLGILLAIICVYVFGGIHNIMWGITSYLKRIAIALEVIAENTKNIKNVPTEYKPIVVTKSTDSDVEEGEFLI